MNKHKIKMAVAVLLCSTLLTSCGRPPFMGGMGGGVPVNTTVLNSTSVEQSGIYQAKLISRYSVNLQTQTSGQISDIYVKAGDFVQAGQTLMSVDKRKQDAALNSSLANSSAAKATLYSYQMQREALVSNLNLNKKLYDRYTVLYSKQSVSKQDLEKYTDSYNKAKSDLNANNAQIMAQKAEIEKAKFTVKEQEVQLQYYKITAPYSGIVGDIPVKIGSFVTPQSQLLNITQNNVLEINAGLPTEKIFEIKTGLPVEVLDNNGKVVATSRISFVSPVVNTDTQTVLVKACLNNPQGIFKADQSLKIRVIYNKAPGLLAPTTAISHFGGQDFVYTVSQKDKKSFVKQQPVKLGNLQGDKYVVISGLKEGDTIVSQGIQKLMDGAPVTIMPEGK